MRMYKIVGSEISFQKTVLERDILVVATDIWENPEKYSDYKNGSDASFYSFLKYLWVEDPNGKETRLAEFIIINIDSRDLPKENKDEAMGTEKVGGWSRIETVKEVEVATTVKRPERIAFELRILCGKCGKAMGYSSSTDESGDVTAIAECGCMFGEGKR